MYDITYKDILYSTVISKCIAMTITYPHEVIRTQLQAQDHINKLLNTTPYTNIATNGTNIHSRNKISITSIIKNIYNKYGYCGFYQGFTISLMRSIPATITTFYIYEQLLQYFTLSKHH
uniref:Mitochondrial nicotinamide adenine dinucleotide transporter 2 n=1 Tax=Lygus hesperus TaxID=30085 RepID=A0A0A9VTY6_LYGHE